MSMDAFDIIVEINDICFGDAELIKSIKETQLFSTTDNMLFKLNATSFHLFVIGGARYWFNSEANLKDESVDFETVFEAVPDQIKCKLIFHLDLLSVNNFKINESEGFWVNNGL
jgi:hypothetical protein